jgi:hypothetical protein
MFRSAGLIDLKLDYDASTDKQIWDQLLGLTPDSIIDRVPTVTIDMPAFFLAHRHRRLHERPFAH